MKEKILKRISRRQALDKDYIAECAAFDDMVNLVYTPPPSLAGMEDAVFFVDPGAHDAEKVANNIYDTYNVKLDILPRGPDDKEEAERLERWLEWQMAQANNHGETEPSRIAMGHAFRYNRICAQMDYLPYWMPKDKSKWTKAQKEQASGGPYCIVLHKPYCVRYEMGKYSLRWAASVSVVPAGDVLDHWEGYSGKSEEGRKIASAMKKIEKLLDDDEEAKVVLVDYTDIDTRYVCCWLSQNETPDFDILQSDNPDVIDIFDGENKLGFINWVISVGSSDGLLTTLHRGHLWQNTNDAESIKRTNAYRRAIYPMGIEEGQGEEVSIDYSGTDSKIVVPPGKRWTPLNPPPLDPAFNELSAQDRMLMNSSTSIQQISSVSESNNIQYATADLFYQISLTQLESYKRTFEKAWKGLSVLCFKWLKVGEGFTEIGYRRATKNERAVAGEQISVGPDDFDEETLFVDAKLIPNTPTNKMQLVNMAKMLKDGGFRIPDSELIERLGYGNPEALSDRWFEEQAEALAFSMFTEEEKAKLQMMVQQKQAETQAALQDQSQPAAPGGQGFNGAAGGSSTSQAAPQVVSREAAQGLQQ